MAISDWPLNTSISSTPIALDGQIDTYKNDINFKSTIRLPKQTM